MNINLNLVGAAATAHGALALPMASLPVWAAASAAPAATAPRAISTVFAPIMGPASDMTQPASVPAGGDGDTLHTAGDSQNNKRDHQIASQPAGGQDEQQDVLPAAPQAGTALPAMAMPLLVLLMPQLAPTPRSSDATTGQATPSASASATTVNASATGSVAAAIGTPATSSTGGMNVLPNEEAGGLPALLAAAAVNRKPAPGADNTAADEQPAPSPAAPLAPPMATPMSVPASAPWSSATGTAPPLTLTLTGSSTAWQQPLKDALGDQLQLQRGRNSDHAVIRLDPPDLGRIDISVKQGNGTLQVNLSASNGDVLRQLHAIGDSLRQDLAQRGSSEVAVQITATATVTGQRGAPAQNYADGDDRQRQPQPQPERADTPGRALDETADDTAPAAARFALYRQQ